MTAAMPLPHFLAQEALAVAARHNRSLHPGWTVAFDGQGHVAGVDCGDGTRIVRCPRCLGCSDYDDAPCSRCDGRGEILEEA